MLRDDSILVVGDLHLPFSLPKYLDFVMEVKNRVKCGKVVVIGDLVDNHTLSFHHDIDPNGYSPTEEIRQSRLALKKWFKAIPDCLFCLGNHDRRIDLKARHVGLPDEVFRPFRDIWGLPKGWKDDFSHEIDGVKYTHGTGLSGDMAHIKAAINARQSCVIGHVHSVGSVTYLVNDIDRIFGMAVGCGIDRKTYAFEYGRDFSKKQFIGCGVVTDKGKLAQVFPMEI